jgi:hypothetical protein
MNAARRRRVSEWDTSRIRRECRDIDVELLAKCRREVDRAVDRRERVAKQRRAFTLPELLRG